jgi:hypothetical protein
MGSKMTEPDLTLYQMVDEVLYYLWDPIGVANSAGPRDEYHRRFRVGSDGRKAAGCLGPCRCLPGVARLREKCRRRQRMDYLIGASKRALERRRLTWNAVTIPIHFYRWAVL